jgi:diguanylate cyclase (GGDEF)-like protein/PAS domain S-box-containing protein
MLLIHSVFTKLSRRPPMTTVQAIVVLSMALQLATLSAVVTYFTLQQRQLVLRDLAQSRTTQALEKLENHLGKNPVRSASGTIQEVTAGMPIDMTSLLTHRTEGRLLVFEANPDQQLSAQNPANKSVQHPARTVGIVPMLQKSQRLGQVESLEFRGQKFYSQVMPWSDGSGKTWQLVSLVLDEDLQKIVSKTDRITFLLSGAGFITATVLGLLSGRQLTGKVRQSLSRLEGLKRHSDERLQRLIINVPGVIYRAVRDANGVDRLTYISSRCHEMYEVSAEQVVANIQVLSKLIAPEDAETMHHLANRAIETLSSWRMEYRICTASGHVKWLEVSASPEVMHDGSIGWDGVILDISDRHRADDIVNVYRTKLEETVKQRTAELETANHELSLMVKIDGLTQIANRRHFDQHLSDDWKRLARSKQPLSLIMCDVDYFKRFNDHYGHPEGDKVLQQIAAILKHVAKRPDDLPARYGGEEFAIILPNTDLVGAMQVAEKIRREVLALRIDHAGSSINGFVTLSLGVATVTPNEITESVRSPQDLIKIADCALYQAKHNGRNQSHVQDSRCLLESHVC